MKTLAIVGASGLVGEKLVAIVADKQPRVRVRLFGNTSVGSRVTVNGRKITVEPCSNLSDGDVHYAMFMANEDVAKTYVPRLAKSGVVCIDNSSYFRLKRNVPLVVTSINGDTITPNTSIIANPNCSTIQTVIALNALKPLGISKITAVTYQSVSGAGKDGLVDLDNRSCYGKLKCFRHPIYDNIIPYIGSSDTDGLTSEEWKLVNESRKILSLPKLKVNSFCCRVPTTVGHGVFVNAVLKSKADTEHARELLSKEPNVIVMDGDGLYPMPLTVRNTKYVAVGRLAVDPTNAYALNMFVVADNLLRGAAYNAYEIFERVLEIEK